MNDTDHKAQFLLQSLLESSLAFEYLEGDAHEVNAGGSRPLAHPFATVGQVQRSSFRVERPGKEPLTVRPNEGYLLPPDVVYGYDFQAPARFVWAHINYRIFDSLNLFHLLHCPLRFPPKVGNAIADINRQLHAFPRDRALSLKEIAEKKVLGFRLLALLLNSGARFDNDIDGLVNIQRLLPVLTFIKNHLGGKITRPMLAAKVSLSETHFHGFFKKTLGMAPMEYVRHQRMQKAQQLLLQTSNRIAHVASQVGFEDQFHFSRQFRATFSLSPTEYRQRRKQMIW